MSAHVQTALLAAVETFDRERIAVIREKSGDMGRTVMRVERQQRDGSWSPAGARITIPNGAIFLIADAMNRSCELAAGDRR